MLTGKLYGETITANTMIGLKRKASIVANRQYNPIDEMEATDGKTTVTLYRINEKFPNNTIFRGEWR